ncbi:MAG: methyltransferase domain-containing protein [Sandaracinaceae bacterium]|nr:methyltransferase domain-containing protein [Sandaracinaceae bacterium]
MSRVTDTEVRKIPTWIDGRRLLGDGAWAFSLESDGTNTARAKLTREQAADLDARLRKVGLGGHLLEVSITPKLSRDEVREGRLVDARRRRETTPGFLRKGTRLDDEGRMSLTPEVLALAVAKQVAGATVLDAGCGVGGNAIAFAREGCRVIAVEQNKERLLLAKHNAALYGVGKRIEFVEGDALALAHTRAADVLFVDPPWGAQWERVRTLLDDFPLLAQLARSSRFAKKLFKVPPSFDPTSASGFVPTAYFGDERGDFRRIKFVLLTNP